MERLLATTYDALPRDDRERVDPMAVEAQALLTSLAINRLVSEGDITAKRAIQVVRGSENDLRKSDPVCSGIALRHNGTGHVDGRNAVYFAANTVLRPIFGARRLGFIDRAWKKMERMFS